MPSFDVVSKIDAHELTNALDQVNREVAKRYDFRGSDTGAEQSEFDLLLHAPNEFQLGQLLDIVKTKFAGRQIDLRSLEYGPVETNVAQARQKITVRQGVSKELGKKVIKAVKDSRLKVQAAIQGDEVRITGKKRDDLQAVIAVLKAEEFDMPLQYVNMRD